MHSLHVSNFNLKKVKLMYSFKQNPYRIGYRNYTESLDLFKCLTFFIEYTIFL